MQYRLDSYRKHIFLICVLLYRSVCDLQSELFQQMLDDMLRASTAPPPTSLDTSDGAHKSAAKADKEKRTR